MDLPPRTLRTPNRSSRTPRLAAFVLIGFTLAATACSGSEGTSIVTQPIDIEQSQTASVASGPVRPVTPLAPATFQDAATEGTSPIGTVSSPPADPGEDAAAATVSSDSSTNATNAAGNTGSASTSSQSAPEVTELEAPTPEPAVAPTTAPVAPFEPEDLTGSVDPARPAPTATPDPSEQFSEADAAEIAQLIANVWGLEGERRDCWINETTALFTGVDAAVYYSAPVELEIQLLAIAKRCEVQRESIIGALAYGLDIDLERATCVTDSLNVDDFATAAQNAIGDTNQDTKFAILRDIVDHYPGC